MPDTFSTELIFGPWEIGVLGPEGREDLAFRTIRLL